MSRLKVNFVPLKYHLRFFYAAVSKITDSNALVHKGLFVYGTETDSRVTHCEMHSFGLHTIGRLLKSETQMPIYIRGFVKSIKKQQPTHIICFDFYHFYFLQSISYAKRNQNCKIVLYSETKRWPKSWLSRQIMKGFLRKVRKNSNLIAKVLVYTKEGETWWRENVPELQVAVLPAPVEVETFHPLSTKEWLPQGTLRVLMNARYSLYKRHEDLFMAAQNILQKGLKLQITLIGRADSGRERVEKLVAQYGLGEVVTFADPQPMEKMPELYHAHDVLVLPSYNEAIGMVVPEAMACGIPTITSDTVGANVYVKDGETGFIFETGNADALVEQLEKCYDKVKLKSMGESARARIENEFSLGQIADRFLSLLGEK